MKKYLGILLCFIVLLCVSGCGNQNNEKNNKSEEKWEDVFSVSKLELKNNRIVAEIKNKKEITYNVVVRFELRSGNSVTEVTELTSIQSLGVKTINSSVGVHCLDGCDEVKIKEITYSPQLPLVPDIIN